MVSTPMTDEKVNAETSEEKPGSFAWFVIKLVLAVLIFRTFIFSPFTIPSESMLPVLMKGDYLLASKWSYGYSRYSLPSNFPLIPGRILAGQPERGDIVIFKHSITEEDYIKRVIGLPGDTVALRNGQVILNGQPLPLSDAAKTAIPLSDNTDCHPFATVTRNSDGGGQCVYTSRIETLPNDRTHPIIDLGPSPEDNREAVIVPQGHLFLMGDNRDNSLDSRFPATVGRGIGIVPQTHLVGRASIILWSTDGGAEWFKPWTWFASARWGRIGNTL